MKYFLSVTLLLVSAIAFSQTQNGNGYPPPDHAPVACKLSGTVVDSVTSLPVEFATVAVYKMKDTTLVNGAVTDEKGTFTIDQLMPGFYFLKVGYIGYATKKVSGIKLTPDAPTIVLPSIYLIPTDIQLKDVTVTDNSDAFQNTIDKKIFNVDKNLSTQGGNALDVLNQIPSVNVDMDGNLTLRGNGNVTVLIDGKPSSLTGGGNNLLSQIPSSTIESVELITNPSAKYSPDGTTGIINIVLKKNHKNGLNGSMNVGIGTGNKYNIGGNINYRNGKWNLFANYGYNYSNKTGYGTTNRKYYTGDTLNYFLQNNNNDNVNASNLLKAGIDFSLNDHNSFTLSSTYSPGLEKKDEIFRYQYLNFDSVLSSASNRTAIGSNTNNNLDASFDYKHTFKKPKEEFTVDVTRSQMISPGTKDYMQVYFDSSFVQLPDTFLQTQQTTNSIFKTWILQSDYTNPFKKGKMECGVKYSHRLIDNDLNSETYNLSEQTFTEDSLINNRFIYNEDVMAGYLVLTKQISVLTFQAGLRAEQAFVQPHLVNTDSTYHNNYFSLFPSAAIMKSMSKDLSLKLSYSRRINRPQVDNLNPFPNYSDPTSIRIGNPYLKPEYVDALEFSVNELSKKYSASTTLYYRQTNNAFLRYISVNDSGVAMVQFTNLNSNNSFGGEFNIKWDVVKNWNISFNTNVFRNEIDASNIQSGLFANNLNYTFRFSSNLSLPFNILFQTTANYRSPMLIAQGHMDAGYNVDAGLRKDMMKKKATLTFNVSDIFDSMHMGINVVTTDFESHMIRKKESRIAMLTFTYRFGAQDKNQKQQQDKPQNNQQPVDMGF